MSCETWLPTNAESFKAEPITGRFEVDCRLFIKIGVRFAASAVCTLAGITPPARTNRSSSCSKTAFRQRLSNSRADFLARFPSVLRHTCDHPGRSRNMILSLNYELGDPQPTR